MKATLALENGTCYEGESAGAPGETSGEVVFNTSMTGYQEILTDPSYSGQIDETSPDRHYGITLGMARRGVCIFQGSSPRESPRPQLSLAVHAR